MELSNKEVKDIGSTQQPYGKYMIGTRAYHCLGDISRDFDGSSENLFYAKGITENYYVGAWVTGMGYVEVLFPKSASRQLTKEEIATFNGSSYRISSQPSYTINVN